MSRLLIVVLALVACGEPPMIEVVKLRALDDGTAFVVWRENGRPRLSQVGATGPLWTVEVDEAVRLPPVPSSSTETAAERCVDSKTIEPLSIRGCLVYGGRRGVVVEHKGDTSVEWLGDECDRSRSQMPLGALLYMPDLSTRFVPLIVGPIEETPIGSRLVVIDLVMRREEWKCPASTDATVVRHGHLWYLVDLDRLTVIDGDIGEIQTIRIPDTRRITAASVGGDVVWVEYATPTRGSLGVVRLDSRTLRPLDEGLPFKVKHDHPDEWWKN